MLEHQTVWTQETTSEDLFTKFKENEESFKEEVAEESLFVDIEDEEVKRKERQEEAMVESPDESFEIVDAEEDSCNSQVSEAASQEEAGDGVQRSFCCGKHRALFMQSSNSIR